MLFISWLILTVVHMAGLDLHWTCVKHNTMYVSVNWSLVQINISFLVSWVIVTQLCPTLCNSMDCSLPSSSVHGILQARILEWVAISISRGSSWPRNWAQVCCIADRFFTIWATREDPHQRGLGAFSKSSAHCSSVRPCPHGLGLSESRRRCWET